MATQNPMGQLKDVCQILRGKDLGLATGDFTLTDLAVKNLTAIKTPCPLVVRLIIKLASGEVRVDYDRTADGVYSASEYNETISNTTEHSISTSTTASLPYVNWKITDTATSGGSVISKLEVDVLGLGDAEFRWYEPSSAFNQFGADGGVFTSAAGD